MMLGCLAVAAVYEAVNELMTRNSPPKLGGEPARTKSEQAGWFPCRYWQLREPPCPRLRSGTPPNLGGECPHSNSFTAPMTADNTPICTAICEIAGGPRSASAKARSLNDRPPLQWPYSTFCAKPHRSGFAQKILGGHRPPLLQLGVRNCRGAL